MKIKKNDLFIGIYLLAAVLFFIISIPSWLLDILLAINILVAMVVLFNSLFAKEVLDMASFPTMLLFTTIFRISLNVSSTKLILKNGDAGKVVDTFGKFVGGGNLVIGIIIFIILIIVQFIVINKGSERVAEVTARFTLDAMAGKQMAIDSDLNTGAITDKEAAERRKKLQQENSFFGSMDGATKYVKGDATAGLIITGINLVGGIVMGMVYGGLSINDALSKYTILTIGDGLSSQIPSLLISLATGILVTKASSDGELGDEIVGQLFSMDRVLIMVGAALSVLGILTPLPWFIGIYLLAAVLFFIISIPSWLLDILLAINILVAMVVLFNSLFAKEVLDMASFPTMLLFTTIFRISLNVSSTKLILKNGDAGKVVDTFGKFVGGGNLVIGIIIFIILIIVQFIVINKGSERVAEVTARFTLDAMAGKQMAIDSDLNTGAITDKEAAERRKKLQQENSFFGSMDGATKYVKGDATAGLIITGINLVGGIVMGMVYGGLSINDALSKYTILTIGDGLSSQIPSLLISLATGILVTKASSDGELGDEIVGQLFSMDRVLIMVGAALSVLGILTPLPWYIFVPLGAALIFYGRKLGTKAGEAKIEESAEQEENEAQEIRKPENVVSLLNVDPIELEFGYGIIPLADVNQGGDLLDRVVMIRRQIALELGAVVPIIRLRDNIQLNPNQYVIKIKGIQVSEGEILFDHYMAMNPGYVEEEITGIPTFEPSFHLPAIWITESQRERAESLGYTVVDPPSIIATHLTEVIRQHIAELLTRQDVQNLINNIKDNNSTLIDELVPKLMGIGEIQKVLQNLLEEGISIRDLVTILETLADHAAVTRDPDILTEYARQGLKRAISSKYFTVGEVTNVVTVDPAIEQEIMNSVKNTEQGSYLSLDPERSKKIVEALGNELKKLEDMGKNPIVITSPIVRMYFRNLAKDYYKDIIVISYNEVESNVELQSVGMVTA